MFCAPLLAGMVLIAKAQSDNRVMLQQEFSALPHHASLPIKQILGITLDSGHIHVEPVLPPTNGFVQCDAVDWPGHVEISIGGPDSLMMHLKQMRLTNHDTTASITEVITGPDYLQIVRNTETMTTVTSVTLIQSRQFEDEGHNPTRLTVQDTREDLAADPPQIKLAGESFAKLRQEHPAELRTYLLPILHDLGAGALLHLSDPVSAWQVLGTSISVDPKMDDRLNSILKHLDADDFATRAKAEEELDTLGPAGAAALEKRDLDRLPPDPRAAVDNFLHREHPLSIAEAQASANSPAFLLDTALLDDANLRDAAVDRLQKLTGHPLDLTTARDAADREQRVEAYRKQYVHEPAPQP